MQKKNVSYLLITLVIIALIVFLAFRNFTKDKPVEELIVSGHPEWQPIMYQQDDLIIGAGPKIVKKIFAELGVNVVSKYEGSWDVVQEKTKNGQIDVLAAAYKTAEREAYMDYSIPYTVDPVVLVVKKGQVFPYDKWEDLISKQGVVMIGDSYGQDFDNYINEKLSVSKVTTAEAAFALLENKKVDYFVYALYAAENYLYGNKASDKFEIIPKYISAENFYITISKKSPFNYLLPQVNELLQKYIDDGSIQQIIADEKKSLWSEDKLR